MSLSRKVKNAKLPLNENSVCSQLVENLTVEEANSDDASESLATLNKLRESPMRRCPSPNSPNIPISKGVESVVKNSNKDEDKQLTGIHVSVERIHVKNETNIKEIVTEFASGAIEEKPQLPSQLSEHKTQQVDLINNNIEDLFTLKENVKTVTEVIIRNEDDKIIETNDKPLSDMKATLIQQKEDSNINSIDLDLNLVHSDNHSHSENNKSDASISVPDEQNNVQPLVESKKLNGALQVENIMKEEVRLSGHSFVSQLSTESDEPLPRLNFMGKSDRSSTGSTILKENTTDETNLEEEIPDQPTMREKLKSTKRPTSTSSIGCRASLVLPEFTVVEENPEDLDEVPAEPSDLKTEAANGIVIHIATEQVTESFTETVEANNLVVNEELPIDNGTLENTVELQNSLEPTKVEQDEEHIIREEKNYVNKIEMKFSTSSIKEKKEIETLSAMPTKIDSSLENNNDKVNEIIEQEEEDDFFPTIGGADEEIEIRTKNDLLVTGQNESMRTSGIQGLKHFLEVNDNGLNKTAQIKSGISRLGHSAAIEKLRNEIPK